MNERVEQPVPTWPVVILIVPLWVLVFTTFSAPGRMGPDAVTSLDWIAAAKVGSRLLFTLIQGLCLWAHWNHPRRAAVLRCLLPLGLFVVWAAASTLWSPLKAVTLGQSLGLLVLWLLAVNLAILLPDAIRMLTHLAAALVGYSLFVVVVAILAPSISGLDRLGSSGLFHPTNAGATASLGLVLLIARQLLWRERTRWLPTVLGCGVHVAAMLIANNRLSIGLAVIVAGLTLASCGTRLMVGGVLLLVALVGVFALALDPGMEVASDFLGNGLSFLERGQDYHQLASLSGRLEMWDAMWKSHQQAPWLGHGYFVTSAQGKLEVWNTIRNHTAHNLWLQALVTTGLLGVSFLAVGIFTPVVAVFRRLLNGAEQEAEILRLGALLLVWYAGWSLLNESIMGPVQPESVVCFAVLGLVTGRCCEPLAALARREIPASAASVSVEGR